MKWRLHKPLRAVQLSKLYYNDRRCELLSESHDF